MKALTGLGDDRVPREDELARTIQALTSRTRELEGRLQRERRFVADASHELRSPLAALRADLDEARLHPRHTDLGHLVGRALRNVDRLEAIITDLLQLAGLEEGRTREARPLDLAALVRGEVARRVDRLPVGVRLQTGVTVDAVVSQMTRVLANLLDNAQRHAEKTVLVEVARRGDAAELTVDDDGDGIAEADRERIFQRFTRLDAARRRDDAGVGLGLAISYDIVRAHRGTLHAADSPAGGARFVLRLPVSGARESDVGDGAARAFPR
ncbi:sensor histidine kinase [Microbispora sp. NPDC049125]|uniref:sensor histidine kinase n=1 Tax=Microbispora sp. NPDC049125 TaxID=3154929 RepID=UPI0034664471